MSEIRRQVGELVTQLERESKKARAVAQSAWLEQRALEDSLAIASAKRQTASEQSDVIDRALAKAESLLEDLSDE